MTDADDTGGRDAAGPDDPRGGRRIDLEKAGGANGAPDQLAAAVRADAVQDVLRTVAAPSALIRADEHVRRCRMDVPVAAFAVRSQLKHEPSIRPDLVLREATRYFLLLFILVWALDVFLLLGFVTAGCLGR
jgi:hypothetical protein